MTKQLEHRFQVEPRIGKIRLCENMRYCQELKTYICTLYPEQRNSKVSYKEVYNGNRTNRT